MEKISLKVSKLSHACLLETENHNHRIIDHFNSLSFEFTDHHIYGVVNSFGSGGQTLINVLTGYESNYLGNIFYNNMKITPKELKNITFCVENRPNYIKKKPFQSNTVLSYLTKAIANNPSFDDTLVNVIKVFYIQRLNHDIRHTSGEQWRIILALGYCMGKKIFCFNWQSYWWLRQFIDTFKPIVDYMKEKGCIIIIPTDRTEGIEGLFDEIIHISNYLETSIIGITEEDKKKLEC